MRRSLLAAFLPPLLLLVPSAASAAPSCSPTPVALTATGNAANHAPKIKVVYARPSNVTDRFATVHDTLRDAATAMGTAISTRSAGTQTLRFDLSKGIECGGSSTAWTPGIADVTLPRTQLTYAFSPQLIASDLRALLPAGSRDDVLAFVDGVSAATGDVSTDSTPGSANVANGGDRVATVPALSTGWSGRTASQTATLGLGALLRTLGVGRVSCPSSDVLCATGTPPALDTLAVDAAGTSYYAPGGSIAGAFNLSDSAFLCRVGSCADTSPPAPWGALVPPVSPVVGQPVQVKWLGANPAPGSALRYEWDVDGSGWQRGAGAPTGDSITFTPTTVGTVPIKVHVTSIDGQSVDSTLSVRIAAAPVATPTTPAATTTTTAVKTATKVPAAVATKVVSTVAPVTTPKVKTPKVVVPKACVTTFTSTKSPLKVGTTPRTQSLASLAQGLVVSGLTRHAPSSAPLKFAVFSGRKRIASKSIACELADGGGFTVKIPLTTAVKAGTTLTVAVVNPRLHAGSGVKVKVS